MRSTALFILSVALLLVVGCSESPLEDADLPEGPVAFETLAQEGDFESLAQGTWGNWDFTERTTIVIRTEQEFADFWEAYHGTAAAEDQPSVDFSQNMVIALLLGERSTTGFAIEAQEVIFSDGRLEVVAEVREPGESCGVGQALTYPYHIISVPYTEAEVDATDTVNVVECP